MNFQHGCDIGLYCGDVKFSDGDDTVCGVYGNVLILGRCVLNCEGTAG